MTPVVVVVGFLALLLASSVGFHFYLLCSQNSSMDRGAVIVVLAISPSAALSFEHCHQVL
jgi:hypothetical protein